MIWPMPCRDGVTLSLRLSQMLEQNYTEVYGNCLLLTSHESRSNAHVGCSYLE